MFTQEKYMTNSEPKKIGLLIGREWSWPNALINEINRHKINQGDFPKEYLTCQLELTVMLKKTLSILTDDR
jgi:hypothetical protein